MKILMAPAWKNAAVQPYTAELSDALVERGNEVVEFAPRRLFQRFDVVHFNWPEYQLRQQSTYHVVRQAIVTIAGMATARLRGSKLIWTVHNLSAHEAALNPRVSQIFFALFTRLLSGFVSLSEAGVASIEAAYPALAKKPRAVVPHASYAGSYPMETTKAQSRELLGYDPDDRVFLFIGQIRKYKNVPALVAAFNTVSASNARLHIAGSPADESLAREIRDLADLDPRVRLQLDFLEPEELQHALCACDAVVLPYAEVFNSGSALLALTYSRPIVVPRTAVFDELAADVGEMWISRFDGSISAADFEVPSPLAGPDLTARTWSHSAELLEPLYQGRS